VSDAGAGRPRHVGRGLFIASLLGLVLIMGAFNLLATYQAVHNADHAREVQAATIEAKICATLHALAALKPPAGNPATNPSRKYLQVQHDTIADLSTDLRCPSP
jgi:hypothetical protein